MRYDLDQLRHLWEVFHEEVHESDEDPECSEACSAVPTFLSWLSYQARLHNIAVERLNGLSLFSGPLCPTCGFVLISRQVGADFCKACRRCGTTIVSQRA